LLIYFAVNKKMSTIRLDLNTNDYITPSQGCINPIFQTPATTTTSTNSQQPLIGGPKISLSLDDIPIIQKPIIPTPQIKAQISLSDCLACSGCVTSAETVLIQAQSVDKLLNQIEHFDIRVVTISPQARASIATRFGVDVVTAQGKIETFLRNCLGIHHILDMGQVFHDISLLETAAEFVHRYRQQQLNTSTTPSLLPLLTSSCPGWVCYVEKEKPEAIPYLSSAKSGQQIAGILLKDALMTAYSSSSNNNNNISIYHLCIMQCPDKKLEASRPEFNNNNNYGPDVDCVLTATEFCDLMLRLSPLSHNNIIPTANKSSKSNEKIYQDQLLDEIFNSLPSTTTTTVINNTTSNLIESLFMDYYHGSDNSNQLLLPTGEDVQAGGSGGYLSFVFRFAAKQLFNVDIPSGPLPLRQGNNPDIQTIELEIEGRSVLRFTACYGFRNIQTIVRKLNSTSSSSLPHFVEIMACPGGCTNGGGQIGPKSVAILQQQQNNHEITSTQLQDFDRRLLSQRVRATLSNSSHVIYRSPLVNEKVAHLYKTFIKGDPYESEVSKQFFHTVGAFKAVPKMIDAFGGISNGNVTNW
jgi:iron only hydrogenase large subunit-like protein